MIVGTIPYMSPEQIEGQKVDHRSDIFSFGTILYEMIAGERPFKGESGARMMSSILTAEPMLLADCRGDLPQRLERLVGRCLEKKPKRRFYSAHDIRNELDEVQRECASGVASAPPSLAVATSAALSDSTPSSVSGSSVSIAVMPFANMSADPENEYFADGLAEELINALTRLPALNVAARTSTFRFKGQQVSLEEIGNQLGVSIVLEGSVRRAGNRVRISAQLINVADGYQVWSEIYDRDMDDIFALQDEVTRAILEQLPGKLGSASGESPIKRYTDNREAYDLYLKGRFHVNRRDHESLRRGTDSFQAALALDPEYALARVGLADVYWSEAIYHLAHPGTQLAKAAAELEQALSIDSNLAEAHASLGIVCSFQAKWDSAEASIKRALELKQNFAFAHAYYAMHLAQQLRVDEMREQIKLALEAEPLSQLIHGLASLSSVFSQNFPEAIAHAETGQETDPDSLICHWGYGLACVELDRHDDAIRELRRAVELSHGGSVFLVMLAYAYARAGRQEEAQQATERATSAAHPEVLPWSLFLSPLATGDRAQSHQLAEEGLRQGMAPLWLTFPRRIFSDLLERVGLPSRLEPNAPL
jgi:TolB-like protein/Flp pilus assembly protein TadD